MYIVLLFDHVQTTVYTTRFTVYLLSVQCTMNVVKYLVYSVQLTVYNVHV